jgi:hypothetical protein
MVNDEEVDDFGGLESMVPLEEDARVGIGEQPASLTGAGEDPVAAATLPSAGEDPVAAAAPPGEDTSVAAAPAAEDPAESAGPSQVAG